MSIFGDYWASQCGNPRGKIGRFMTWAMNRANNVMYHGIVENIKLFQGMKLLDVGFGNGYLEKLLYNKGKCTIYGIDISEDMVKLAAEKNKQGIANGDIHLSVGDCCRLVFEDHSFDVVTTMNTIYFWENTVQGLQEIYRVLKQDGLFYNAVLTKESLDRVFYTKNGFQKFEKEDYIKMGYQAGFKHVSFESLGHDYGLLVIYEK